MRDGCNKLGTYVMFMKPDCNGCTLLKTLIDCMHARQEPSDFGFTVKIIHILTFVNLLALFRI